VQGTSILGERARAFREQFECHSRVNFPVLIAPNGVGGYRGSEQFLPYETLCQGDRVTLHVAQVPYGGNPDKADVAHRRRKM
jgi:hypothetical protein